MNIVIEQTVYEPIPVGLYPATIESIELENDGKFGPQILFKFKLDPFGDYPDGKEMRAWASKKFSQKSKLYKWTRNILGNIPAEYNFNSADLLNKRVLLSVGHKEKDGLTFDQIEEVMVSRAVARNPESQPKAEEINAQLAETEENEAFPAFPS